MKVHVFDYEVNLIQILKNVIKVKNCLDGRTLVNYEKKCECCNHVTIFTKQIPQQYVIRIFIENSDEINLFR